MSKGHPRYPKHPRYQDDGVAETPRTPRQRRGKGIVRVYLDFSSEEADGIREYGRRAGLDERGGLSLHELVKRVVLDTLQG